MKTSLLIVVAALFILPLWAQDTTDIRIEEFTVQDNQEVTTIRLGKGITLKNTITNSVIKPQAKKTNKKRMRWHDGHWSGLGLNYNALVSSLNKLSLPNEAADLAQSPKSIGVTFNLIDVMLPITRNLGLVSGIGMEFNNFRFSKDIGLMMENGVTKIDYQYVERGINLSKSKLNTAYLNIPLLLEVQFGHNNKFYVNGGIVGGLRMGAHTKIRANHPELKGRFKERDNISLKSFHYGYTVGLGYNQWGITASYYPGSLFRNNTGPKLEQINIGIIWLLNYSSR